VISRVSNRVLLGLPLCRDPEFLPVTINIATSVVASAELLKRIPTFLRPFAGKWLSGVPTYVKHARKFVGPIITERQRKIAEFGDNWADKPNDMLAWLMDEAKGEERTEVRLVTRILTLNFAALHTSTMTFTHILFHLAANPEYATPMREEIERVVARDGWSKASLGTMYKLDSFVRESARVNGIGSIALTRLALKPYTFANGLHIPKGAWIAVPAAAIHGDDEHYEDALAFKPFRHASSVEDGEDGDDVAAEDVQGKVRPYAVSTGPEYLPFGHGQHACPGRFFAVTEVKMMLAYILLNYDVKLENEGVRPPNVLIGDIVMPDTKAEVMFRKRRI